MAGEFLRYCQRMGDLKVYYFLILIFSTLSTISLSLYTFHPEDNILISAGSVSGSSFYNRYFLPDDHRSNPNSPLLSSCPSTAVSAFDRSSDILFDVHRSARIFTKRSKYAFKVKDSGIHIVRLHFFPFLASDLDLSDALFHVLIDGYVALTNFSISGSLAIKEYFIPVHDNVLTIEFVPVNKGNFAFVNAIEIISAPKDLIPDRATLVKDGELVKFTSLALETVHRFNVGGSLVTPFNDTLWRTWVPDDLVYKSVNISKRVFFSGQIHYIDGGASREVAPDFVYKTGRVISSENDSVPDVKMTWEIPIAKSCKYLVRLHFCDIASTALYMINFNVYVNGYLATERLDLSSAWNALAAPAYKDFVLDSGNSAVLAISIGPSNESIAHSIDGILNGIEVMKMNNSMGSLDGEVSVHMILRNWRGKDLSTSLQLLAAIILLMTASFILYKRVIGCKHNMAWTRLPTSSPELSLKHSIPNSATTKV